MTHIQLKKQLLKLFHKYGFPPYDCNYTNRLVHEALDDFLKLFNSFRSEVNTVEY